MQRGKNGLVQIMLHKKCYILESPTGTLSPALAFNKTTAAKDPSDFKMRLLIPTCAGNQAIISIQRFIIRLRAFQIDHILCTYKIIS